MRPGGQRTTGSPLRDTAHGQESRRGELRRVCDSLWQTWLSTAAGDVYELQRLIDPHALTKATYGEQSSRYRHCARAKAALDTLVSAHSTYITPAGQRWFALKTRKKVQEHSGRKSSLMDWYTQATEVMTDELSETNFYNTLMEVYNDRVLGGTGCCFIGGNDELPLHFVHVPLGNFAIAEDCYGHVNTLVRRFRWTAAQAAEAWGVEALPEVVRQDYLDPARRYDEASKRDYLHLVRPRSGMVTRGLDRVPYELREFEGFYILEDDFSIIKEEGYFEFPYLVTRFMRGNESPYGVAPGVAVIPTIRQLMKLERLQDVMAEKAAFPSILQLASQNRQIDTRAGGITTVSLQEAQAGYPREWGSSGRYDIGLERIRDKEEQIRQAYFADMLNAMSQIERQMTATEVNAREAEKVLAFSPSFHLFISDFQVAARRILSILYRKGKLPQAGKDNDLFIRSADGREWMMNPRVCFLGKIAQAIERVQRRGIEDVLQTIISYTQSTGDSSMLESLNPRMIGRYIVESSGAPADIIKSDAELAVLDEQKAAMMAAQQEQQDAVAAAEVLSKAGGVAGKMQRGGAA